MKKTGFKFKIGEIIKDDSRNITIINTEIRKSGIKKIVNKKYYKYHCNICEANLWMEESNINSGQCCACCSNRKIIKGINDIATTNPEMVKYFVNIEDVYTYSKCSNKKVLCKCPNCGYEKSVIIENLYEQGFSCNKCSDGISFPNKFMFNLLTELNVEFETEYSPEWIKHKRYDFYIPSMKLIIEMDGGLGHGNRIHSKDNKTIKETLEIDDYKDKIAKEHGLNVVRVDCNYKKISNKFNFIVKSILESLFIYFNLNEINWTKIYEISNKSNVKKTCDYWNNNKTIHEISTILKILKNTIRSYLKTGMELKWCDYSAREELRISIDNNRIIKPILCVELDTIFESATYIEKNSKEIFGFKLDHRRISDICIKNNNKKYNGYTFKFVYY